MNAVISAFEYSLSYLFLDIARVQYHPALQSWLLVMQGVHICGSLGILLCLAIFRHSTSYDHAYDHNHDHKCLFLFKLNVTTR